MKKITIIIFLLIHFNTFSQSVESCSYDKIISVQGGLPFNFNVEGGIQTDFLGAFIGAKMTLKNIRGNEVYPASQTANVNAYVKLTGKVFGGDDDFMRVYIVAYGGKNIWGTGAKVAFLVSDYVLIFIEPKYTEQGKEGNIGLSLRF